MSSTNNTWDIYKNTTAHHSECWPVQIGVTDIEVGIDIYCCCKNDKEKKKKKNQNGKEKLNTQSRKKNERNDHSFNEWLLATDVWCYVQTTECINIYISKTQELYQPFPCQTIYYADAIFI